MSLDDAVSQMNIEPNSTLYIDDISFTVSTEEQASVIPNLEMLPSFTLLQDGYLKSFLYSKSCLLLVIDVVLLRQ